MKIKGDFVTNSSSSSFVGIGVIKTLDELSEILYSTGKTPEKLESEDVSTYMESLRLDITWIEEFDGYFIGAYFYTSDDDGVENQGSVLDMLNDAKELMRKMGISEEPSLYSGTTYN